MEIELYAGPLVRWYRQEFVGGSKIADPPEIGDIVGISERWREAFAPAVGRVVWSEEIDAPVAHNRVSAAAWTALRWVAASVSAELDWDDPMPDEPAPLSSIVP